MVILQTWEHNDWLQLVADIFAILLNILKPIVQPVGQWMILWIGAILQYFPDNDLTIYLLAFIILVIAGMFINIHWPGDEPLAIYEKKGERIEESVNKCPECGNAMGSAEECPYCGHIIKK